MEYDVKWFFDSLIKAMRKKLVEESPYIKEHQLVSIIETKLDNLAEIIVQDYWKEL